MRNRLAVAVAFFLLLSGALLAINAQDQRPRPGKGKADERALQVSERQALQACGASPVALREMIANLPRPQGYHCPDWSTHCWCSGGAGSEDCNNLKTSGKCSGDIQTGTSADGNGLAGICKK